ncbi:MAG: serine/threonine protein kinase, partial [Pirellulales bacterium]
MSMTTTLLHETRTITHGGNRSEGQVNELLKHYLDLVREPKLAWTEHLWLRRQLGKGGQGIVYLSERRGAD